MSEFNFEDGQIAFDAFEEIIQLSSTSAFSVKS